MKEIQVMLCADAMKMTIVVTRFNDFIGKNLVESCRDMLVCHGVQENNIHVYRERLKFR